MELTIDQALQKAIEAHKAGQVQEADRLYTAILKAQPRHPDANHNMGVLAVGVGKVQEALPFFKTALEVNPDTAQYWLSYIDALIKLDRLTDAKVVFDQAKEKGATSEGFDKLERKLEGLEHNVDIISDSIDPPKDHLKALIDLYSQSKLQQALDQACVLLKQFPSSSILYNVCGTVYKSLGQFDASVDAYNKALNIKPDYAEVYNNIGVAFQEQGKLKEAIKMFDKALDIKPDYADTYYNLGNALKMQGSLKDSIEAYNSALKLRPDFAKAYINMGATLKKQGELEEAIEAYNKALSLKPDYAEAYYNMGIALKGITFTKPRSDLQKTITAMLKHKTFVRPKDIASAATSLLKFEQVLKELFRLHSHGNLRQSFKDTVLALSELPLLLELMRVCPLADLELETALTDIRSGLLSFASEMTENRDLLHFQSALALQCFTNEYVYEQNEGDTELLGELEANVNKILSNGQQPSPQSILCLASYKALHEYEWCDLLTVTSDIEEVSIRQFLEPKLEANIRLNIPVLEEITNNVSSKVREQYEDSPYPRWINLRLSLKPSTISDVVHQSKLKLFDYKINEVDAPSILIAGCGTGQHPIETTARFKNSKILAIDLSLSSLAYAKRKTEKLNIQNIEYTQADILDLGKLDRKFDIIESVGVLHHMDDTMAGWKVLTDCLKQGGLMKIGLYSELARHHIVKMRGEIAQSGIGSSDLEIKSFRKNIINSDKEHHKFIRSFSDFYNMSELRDLLFHVQEHRFTLLQIQEYLSELGLKFCGFEKAHNIQKFKSHNSGADDPYDLEKWAAFEEANPKTFAEMYQFWCQKIA
jgi:tetratricopeptide (TPR) repeat protein/SAM-dependent methyltransferase